MKKRTTPLPLPGLGRLMVWSALLAGIGELAARLLGRAFLAEPVFINPASVWLGPLSALLLFAPLIVMAWLLGRLGGPQGGSVAAVAAAAFLALLDVLMLAPRLHPLALVLVAGGLASRVVWVARRWPAFFNRAVWASTLLLGVVAIGGSVLVSRRPGGLSARPDLPGRGAPNVLLLVLDTVRALELSAYGYERLTSPHLDALAAEGVRFDLAVANAPWTLATHATLFTGRFQRDLSVGWSTPLDTVSATLAEQFVAQGYATGGFVANHRYVSREYGLGRGFQTYRDYALVASLWVGATMLGRQAIGVYNGVFGRYVVPGRKDAAQVVDEFLAWQEVLGDRPYFGFLNLFDAHEPYAPQAPFDRLFAPDEPATRRIETARAHSPAEVQGLRDAYDGAIASVDAQLGRLFAELRRRGALDRTIVIVTSDHGEEFAEHGHLSHGNGLHFPALHVPLIIRWPAGGVPGGVRVPEPVSLADVPATILDLAGLGGNAPIPGLSLAPRWRGGALEGNTPILSELYWAPNQPDWYPVAGGDMHSLVQGRFHYIAGPGNHEELYDIVADPFELHDLARDPSRVTTLKALREALARYPMADRGGR